MPRQLGELGICRDLVSILGDRLADYLDAVRDDDSEVYTDDLSAPDPETGYVISRAWTPPAGRANAIQIYVSDVTTPSQWRSPAGPLRQTVVIVLRWYLTTSQQDRIDEMRFGAGRALRECIESNWRTDQDSSAWILSITTSYNARVDSGSGDGINRRERMGLPPTDHVRLVEMRITFSQIQPAALR